MSGRFRPRVSWARGSGLCEGCEAAKPTSTPERLPQMALLRGAKVDCFFVTWLVAMTPKNQLLDIPCDQNDTTRATLQGASI